jgi:hypothetical protein
MSTDKISDRLPADKRLARSAVHVVADDHRDVRREVILTKRNAQGVEPLQLPHEELNPNLARAHWRRPFASMPNLPRILFAAAGDPRAMEVAAWRASRFAKGPKVPFGSMNAFR